MTVVEEKTLSLLAAASGVCDKDTEMEYSQLGGVVLFARNHTVDALVADAVVEGRVRFVGDKEKCAGWTKMVMGMASLQMQFRNIKRMYDEALTDFARVMEEGSIDYVVFKGPAVASLYAHPSARTMGDIDFYVPQWDYSKAVEMVEKELGVEIHRCEVDKHDAFDYKGIRFEMHYQMETFGAEKHQRYFSELVDDSIRNGRVRFFETSVGGRIARLEPMLDIMVVMKHLMTHFIGEGVGLRQLTDYVVMQKAYFKEIDVEVLRCHLSRIGYLRAFDNMVDLTARYFHLRWEEYETKMESHNSEMTERFMRDVLKNGNFGRMDYKHSVGWKKRLETTMRFFSNIMRYYSLAPWDMMCMVPKRISISVMAHR